jgi:hypothetical protein
MIQRFWAPSLPDYVLYVLKHNYCAFPIVVYRHLSPWRWSGLIWKKNSRNFGVVLLVSFSLPGHVGCL